jgi:hypothetical protein
MTTRIRIERVVLDGLRLTRRERDALAPAIARELSRLAGEPPGRAEAQRREVGPAVDGIAREIAAAVHRATAAHRVTAVHQSTVRTRPAASRAAGPAGRRGRG